MIKSQGSYSTTELVAFHKRKRIFLKLKDLAVEDPDQLEMCEFKGHDIQLIADRDRSIRPDQ